jgi:hypothetical protein
MNKRLIALAAALMLAAMPAFAQSPLFFRCHETARGKDFYYRISPTEFIGSKVAVEGQAAIWNANQCNSYEAVCTWEKGVLTLRDKTFLQVFDTNTGIYRMGPLRVGLDTTLNCTRLATPP